MEFSLHLRRIWVASCKSFPPNGDYALHRLATDNPGRLTRDQNLKELKPSLLVWDAFMQIAISQNMKLAYMASADSTFKEAAKWTHNKVSFSDEEKQG